MNAAANGGNAVDHPFETAKGKIALSAAFLLLTVMAAAAQDIDLSTFTRTYKSSCIVKTLNTENELKSKPLRFINDYCDCMAGDIAKNFSVAEIQQILAVGISSKNLADRFTAVRISCVLQATLQESK